MKHTPGPWIYTTEKEIRYDVDTGKPYERRFDFIRAGKDNISIAAIIGMRSRAGESTLEPDAKLIAAAPDLLEALEEMVELMEAVRSGDYKPDSFTTQPALSAIKKARGEI